VIPIIRITRWLAAMFLLPAISNEVIVIDAAQDRIVGRIGELENAHSNPRSE